MVTLDTIVSLCKRRGFIFQSSEIYGGLGSAWDYGPLGAELKRNIKNLWWRDNVQRRYDMCGLDAAISMHPEVWKASGHADNFADPFMGCTKCNSHFRTDQLLQALRQSKWVQAQRKMLEGPSARKDETTAWKNWYQTDGKKLAPNLSDPTPSFDASRNRIRLLENPPVDAAVPDGVFWVCPGCGGPLSEPKPANLMLEIFLGPVKETATRTWLRPETAQGIFVNFENVQQSMRKKLPFGIAQVGKSFRNEITPGNFIFRTREFEQMEIEYFVKPGTDEEWHQKWIDERFAWYSRYGIRKENLQLREHARDELAHYAKRCVDIEYLFPMGWSELEGIANRSDYDLRQHSKFSGKVLEYFDEETKQKIVPYVIEPSAGADRSTLAFLLDAYHEEEVRGEKRVVLRFRPEIAPLKIAVLPLLKKNDKIVQTAKALCDQLNGRWMTVYDDTAAIGKLYRRQDEVGTPFCVTVDVQTVGDPEKGEPPDHKVTIRDRDSMQQVRVPMEGVSAVFDRLMSGKWAEVAAEHPSAS